MTRQIKLGVSMRGLGYHASAWRLDGVPPDGDTSYEFYHHITKTAERALFDLVFLADYVALKAHNVPAGYFGRTTGMIGLEPITLLSALAPGTKNIGLAATVSTTFQSPYHIARTFASLDHISHGRAAWNMVTSFQDEEAQNFGDDEILEKASRYERAAEAVEVVSGLWDSWDDDAFVMDRKSGVYFDPARMHKLNHKGKYFSSAGPLNVPRTPQGRPIIIQAGASATGQELAAASADIVYAAETSLANAQKFYSSVKARMGKYGRSPDDLKVMPGLLTVVGETRAEAQAKYRAMQEAIDPIVGLGHLAPHFGDLSGHDLDGPVPEPRKDRPVQSRTLVAYEMAQREKLSIRQLYQRTTIGNAHNVVVGTASDVVDMMEEWFVHGGADGFNVLPALSPVSFVEFVDTVVPELQRRGLYRTKYESNMLRENLGLSAPRPISTAPAKQAKYAT